MDIIQELKERNEKTDALHSILSHLDAQKEEMNKKLHLLRVISLADAIDKRINNGYFRENDVTKFEISQGVYGVISIYFSKKDDDLADKMDDIDRICSSLNEFKTKYANKDLDAHISPKRYKVRIDKNFKNKLFDALLSDELKTIFEYSQMHLELSDNKNSNTKKVKM